MASRHLFTNCSGDMRIVRRTGRSIVDRDATGAGVVWVKLQAVAYISLSGLRKRPTRRPEFCVHRSAKGNTPLVTNNLSL